MAEEKSTITKFKDLPDPVRGWLASTQITYLISDLNRRLGFGEEEKMRVIPTLILRLAIANLDPENFISELSKLLDLSPSAAKTLAQEIEERMLRPIEIVLRNELGIDVKLMHFAREAVAPSSPVATGAPALIPSPEAAHPSALSAPAQPAPEPRPAPPPIYHPQPTPPIQPAPPPPAPAPRPSIVMPKVEPLPARPAPPPTAPRVVPPPSAGGAPSLKTDGNKETPVRIKVEPSKVPNFMREDNFGR